MVLGWIGLLSRHKTQMERSHKCFDKSFYRYRIVGQQVIISVYFVLVELLLGTDSVLCKTSNAIDGAVAYYY